MTDILNYDFTSGPSEGHPDKVCDKFRFNFR